MVEMSGLAAWHAGAARDGTFGPSARPAGLQERKASRMSTHPLEVPAPRRRSWPLVAAVVVAILALGLLLVRVDAMPRARLGANLTAPPAGQAGAPRAG